MQIDAIANNYENLAESWARRIDQPFSVTPHDVARDLGLMEALWRGIYPEVLEQIELDPQSFAERVSVYRLAATTANDCGN